MSWRPKGLSDSLDGTESFTGAMSALTNLIPDPSTSGLWQCRPAAILLGNANGTGPFSSGFSSGFQGPTGDLGIISCWKTVGNFLYGMAASSTTVPGNDLPFCFNLTNNTKVAVGGTINASTTPQTQPTTGPWTPPQMDVVGPKVLVAHPGFSGSGGNFAGYFDITTPGSPVWHASNMGGAVAFTFPPTGVKQFFNRAYWIHNVPAQPAVIFSDVLNPFNATNANQVLTFGDSATLTALGALPLNNQLGGIVQALIVFKGTANMYQITGDAALSTLAVNTLNVATGTLAPNSIAPTPKGLAFVSPEGLRYINFTGNVSDPIGQKGRGIAIPFIYAAQPSRIAAAANGSLYRATVQNAQVLNSPSQEYWYNFVNEREETWSGPHTFTSNLVIPYLNTFIVAPIGLPAQIWQSDYLQTQNSTFIEKGQQLTWNASTVLLPDTDQMINVCITETTVDFSLPKGLGTVSVLAEDQNSSVINNVTIRSPTGGGGGGGGTPYNTIWGAFTWGNALWGSGTIGPGGGSVFAVPQPFQVTWTLPIVWSRGFIDITGPSAQGFVLGTIHLRYQIVQMLTNTAAAA